MAKLRNPELMSKVKLLRRFKSAEELAATLSILGIRGVREDNRYCPIARAINSPFERRFLVDEFVADDEWGGCYKAPPTTVEFIERFDDGDFPDLEVKGL